MMSKGTLAGAVLLGGFLAFASMPAHAVPIFYTVTYVPAGAFNGDTTFQVALFLDDTDIGGIGTEEVVLSGVDVIFNGSFTLGLDQFVHYANDRTDVCTFLCGGANFEPFRAEFTNGTITGFVTGRQPGPGGIGLGHIQFGVGPLGFTVTATFFGTAPNKFNGETDRGVAGPIAGPFLVPEPGTFGLLGASLIGLGLLQRRRRSAA
jgi:hypothetical protein